MKRILLTGAAGFIGSNLAHRCVADGLQFDAVDDLSNGHAEFLPRDCTFWQSDFSSDFILDLIKQKRYDVIIHLAAVPRVSYSVEHPLLTNDSNVTKTLKLIDAARGNVNRFVFASSSSVYGGADTLPTPETHRKNPKSPYALQKSVIEDYLKLYSFLYNLDSVCLRFFNVFGPRQLGDSPYATAVSAWLSAIKKGVSMRSDGDGTQSRDMCYVDNVVDACLRASFENDELRAECINVACEDSTTNNRILELLKKKYPNATSTTAPWRVGDVMHTLASVEKAKNLIGYVPIVRFEEGLERTISWYEDNWETIKDMKLNV